MNQNLLKILVPIIAVIVLVESVLLLSGLQKKQTASGSKDDESKPTEVVKTADPAVFDIKIAAEKTELGKDESTKVTVTMKGNSKRALDSVNVYVKYDTSAFDVPKLTFDKKLPQPAFSKVSTNRGLLVANFLISEPKGLQLGADEDLAIMSFDIVPKKAGKFDFEISTGNEMKESATMIVENATSKSLPFSSNKLTVNVSE